MIIIGLVKSLKTMNRHGPTVTFFDSLFHENIKDRDVKFEYNLDSGLQFVLSKS